MTGNARWYVAQEHLEVTAVLAWSSTYAQVCLSFFTNEEKYYASTCTIKIKNEKKIKTSGYAYSRLRFLAARLHHRRHDTRSRLPTKVWMVIPNTVVACDPPTPVVIRHILPTT
jgi:hypothetical protein